MLVSIIDLFQKYFHCIFICILLLFSLWWSSSSICVFTQCEFKCALFWISHSRSDLGLKENKDEDQQGRNSTGEHHPDREWLLLTKWADDPASSRCVGHGQPLWHHQFLKQEVKKHIETIHYNVQNPRLFESINAMGPDA